MNFLALFYLLTGNSELAVYSIVTKIDKIVLTDCLLG